MKIKSFLIIRARCLTTLCLACVCAIGILSAQPVDTSGGIIKKTTNAINILAPKKGRIYNFLLPIIAANPANGFSFGAGDASNWFLGDTSDTKISTAMVGFTFTTKEQFLSSVKSTIFSAKNNWIFNGDWRYFISSQPTFGLGTGPQSAKLASHGYEYSANTFSQPIVGQQPMEYTLMRFYETAVKKIWNNVYGGIGYHLDNYSGIDDDLVNVAKIPPVITSNYAYNVKYGFNQSHNTLSGLSADIVYDSRDNQNNTYKGSYAIISFRINSRLLGSTKSSSTLWVEYRNYFNITKNHHNILAVWGVANLNTSGVLPYMDLPALGWDQYGKSGRGYAQGRFRGTNLLYTEAEYRKHLLSFKKIPDFLAVVLFANATSASGAYNNIRLFQYINPAAGAGLRFMVSANARTTLALDYGFGSYSSRGLYLRLNQTF